MGNKVFKAIQINLTFSLTVLSLSNVAIADNQDGVLLTGAGSKNAINALIERTPKMDGMGNSSLAEAVINPKANVKQVNDALKLVNAKISTMAKGIPMVSLSHPEFKNLNEANIFVNRLKKSNAFLSVYHNYCDQKPMAPDKYKCPDSERINCMPGGGCSAQKCEKNYINWAKKNCPGFKGISW